MTNDIIRFHEVKANDGECNWRVEYHEYSAPYPLGTAYVTDRSFGEPILYFVLVADQNRRQGIGTALIRACQKRWPSIFLTDAISDSGEALLNGITLESVEEQ